MTFVVLLRLRWMKDYRKENKGIAAFGRKNIFFIQMEKPFFPESII